MTPAEAVKFMKEHGILHMKDGDLEISLHPRALEEPEAEPDPKLQPEKDLDDVEKSPVTGLTRKRSQELLGFVNEAEFKKA